MTTSDETTRLLSRLAEAMAAPSPRDIQLSLGVGPRPHNLCIVTDSGTIPLENHYCAPWMTAREASPLSYFSDCAKGYFRRGVVIGTSTEWNAMTQVLGEGTIVAETDTACYKQADGKTLCKDLPYSEGYVSRSLFDPCLFVFWLPKTES